MRRLLHFRTLVMDTVKLQQPTTTFLLDRHEPVVSVTTWPEARIVDFIVAHPALRTFFLDVLLRTPGAFVRTRAIEPFISDRSRKPGDVDVMVADRPDEALAIECKRVKLTAIDQAHNRVNKLEQLADGVQQANALHDLGFFQTYFAILTAVDARIQTHRNIPNRGLDPETTHNYGEANTFTRLVEFPNRERLHEEIGILFLELVQTTGANLTDQCILGLCIDHQAQPRLQTSRITNCINECVSVTRRRH